MEKGKLAFDELRRIAADNGLAGMNLEEINEEIRKVREGTKTESAACKPCRLLKSV